MLRPYDLLENILIDIEKGIGEGINSGFLAKKYSFFVFLLLYTFSNYVILLPYLMPELPFSAPKLR